MKMRLFAPLLAIPAVAVAAGVFVACPASSQDASDGTVVSRASVRESRPGSLVAAVENESGDVYASVVLPCREKKEQIIAAERQREESCAECQAQLPQLAIVETQAMSRCDIKGYDARIADIDRHIDTEIERFKKLAAAFEQQARSSEALGEEIKEGETEAEATFAEAAAGKIMDWAPEKQIDMIDATEKMMQGGKDVRRATRGELGAFVAEMRAELRGKSKREARAILLKKLEQARRLTDRIKAVNFTSQELAANNIDKVAGIKSDTTSKVLDEAYGALVTGLSIAKDQSVKSLQEIVKLNGVLGYSQDTVKIGQVFGNLNQLSRNVDGLSSLAQAAESQRVIAKAEMDYLVQKRKILVEQRDEAASIAGGP